MSVNGRFDADVAHQQSAIQFGAIEFPFNDGAILRNSEGTTKSKRTVISIDKRKIWVLFASSEVNKNSPGLSRCESITRTYGRYNTYGTSSKKMLGVTEVRSASYF
ncbi:MAG: hypothetical protein HOD27_09085 [Betaproteobacteria bacterium]|nr:hypothetical protein [Betaproteobacteria bacterium]